MRAHAFSTKISQDFSFCPKNRSGGREISSDRVFSIPRTSKSVNPRLFLNIFTSMLSSFSAASDGIDLGKNGPRILEDLAWDNKQSKRSYFKGYYTPGEA
jgi:hypothetical protein